MKLDVRTPLLSYRGQPIVEGDRKNFRDFVDLALNSNYRAETLGPDDKKMAYEITTKLYNSNKVKLSSKEEDYIKLRAQVVLPALHAGRIVNIIDEQPIMTILPEEDLNSELEAEKPDGASGSK